MSKDNIVRAWFGSNMCIPAVSFLCLEAKNESFLLPNSINVPEKKSIRNKVCYAQCKVAIMFFLFTSV